MIRMVEVLTYEPYEVYRQYRLAEDEPLLIVGCAVELRADGLAQLAMVPADRNGVVAGKCTHYGEYETERDASRDFTERHAKRCGYEPHVCEWPGCEEYTSGWYADPNTYCAEHS